MGKGITSEKLSRIQAMKGGSGVGLAGMRERLRLVRGHFEIESGPDGTRLRATAPVEMPKAPPLNACAYSWQTITR
jgi:signal transduction histidine kinase